MKKVITGYLLWLALSPSISFSQTLAIELTGDEGRRVKEFADKFAGNLSGETKAVRFIYIDARRERNDYYFGLITDKSLLISNPPTYYFFNSSDEPIVVYTGFEKNIKFSQTYIGEIRGLADKFLFSGDLIMTLHYYVWYVRFENGKQIEFTERLDKKRQHNIPDWITKF